MAFLEMLNIQELLGNTPELTTFKRTSDKVDGYLAVALALVGVTMFTVYWGKEMIMCVPSSCRDYPDSVSPDCSRTWEYQTELCQDEILTWPDTNFHYMLIGVSALFLGLMGLPIYQGHKDCQSLFSRFYGVWSTFQNDSDGKLDDKEWRRDMTLLVEQLKSDSQLSRKYATYHSLGLFAVIVCFGIVSLYTVHFFNYDLSCVDGEESVQCSGLSFFKQTNRTCSNDHFICQAPDQDISAWFGTIALILLFLKGLVNLGCIMFSLGLPGLFGRRFLVFLGQLTDSVDKRVYYIQTNPIKIITSTTKSLLYRVFVLPVYNLSNLCKFYYRIGRKNVGKAGRSITKAGMEAGRNISKAGTSLTNAIKMKTNTNYEAITIEPTQETNPEDASKDETNLDEVADEVIEEKTRDVPSEPQNWCDLFFILDILSNNADESEVLIFISKIEEHIPPISSKQVDTEASFFDSSSNSLVLLFSHAGIIESLLQEESATEGGLSVLGWLESGDKSIWPEDHPDKDRLSLKFTVSLGASYTLVAAVYGRGRILVRINNLTFQLNKDVKKLVKKYGAVVPLCYMIAEGK